MSNGETVKAQRAMVHIGNLEVEGFMLPDGSYRMSQQQAAECIDTSPQNASNFLRSKAFKALQEEGSTDQTFPPIEVESSQQATGGTRINALPLDVVWAFWLYQCSRGNKTAYALLSALGTESIERRFDLAFGIARSEADYTQRLAERMERLEQTFGDAFAFADEATSERDYFLRLLQENGIDPYSIPGEEE